MSAETNNLSTVNPLAGVETVKLLAELSNRFQNSVFIGSSYAPTGQVVDYRYQWRGSAFMVAAHARKIAKDIEAVGRSDVDKLLQPQETGFSAPNS